MASERRTAFDPALDLPDEAPLSAEDEALIKRVHGRVMKEIAAESVRHHAFLQPDEGKWDFFLPGIERKVLHADDTGMSYLLRFRPGAVLPAHRHPADEETIVLQGTLQIGPVLLRAGGYHRVGRHILDADATAQEETVLFVRGATPLSRQIV